MVQGCAVWPNRKRPVVGMVHLPPLPGSPRYGGNLEAVRTSALRDAETLASEGVHGLMIENFGDVPFFPDRVPAEVVSAMTAIAAEIRRRFDIPLGINVLRNDGISALAVAVAVGAAFIRVNVLCGARVTDQGIVQAIAHRLQRRRAQLGATAVQVFADVNVKHSAPLAMRPIEDEVQDSIERGGADAVIVSGTSTGQATDLAELQRVKQAASVRVLVGSGVTVENLDRYIAWSDGFIVGTGFKDRGQVANLVDASRVRAFMEKLAQCELDFEA